MLMTNLNLATGTTAGDTAYAYFMAQLEAQVQVQTIAVAAVDYLNNDARNSMFDVAALALNNKAAGSACLIDSGIRFTSLADLDVIRDITSDDATLTDAIDAIDVIRLTLVDTDAESEVDSETDATTLFAGNAFWVSSSEYLETAARWLFYY